MDDIEQSPSGLPAAVAEFSDDAALVANSGSLEECAEMIERITAAQSSLAAMQAAVVYRYEKNMVMDHEERGVYLYSPGKGANTAVAMLRHRSADSQKGYLPACRMLVEEAPFIFGLWQQGLFTEDQILAMLAPLLKLEQRFRIMFDKVVEANPDMFEGMGTGAIRETVSQWIMTVAPEEAEAEQQDLDERRYLDVKVKEGYVQISGRLPVAEGMAFKNSIESSAKQWKREHLADPRTQRQLRADMLPSCLSGQCIPSMPLLLGVKIVMTDKSLFFDSSEPAFVEGYGYIPAAAARALVASETRRRAAELMTLPEFQRLFVAPDGKSLVAMESKARIFPDKLKALITVADRERCRTPYCNRKITQIDHLRQHAKGGKTCFSNGDGRCGYCNLAKEIAGWHETRVPGDPRSVQVRLPGGRIFRTLGPPPSIESYRKVPNVMKRAWWIGDVC